METIVSGGRDEMLRVWSLGEEDGFGKFFAMDMEKKVFKPTQSINTKIGEVTCLSLSRDLNLIIAGGSEHHIKIYKLSKLKGLYEEIQRLKGHKG